MEKLDEIRINIKSLNRQKAKLVLAAQKLKNRIFSLYSRITLLPGDIVTNISTETGITTYICITGSKVNENNSLFSCYIERSSKTAEIYTRLAYKNELKYSQLITDTKLCKQLKKLVSTVTTINPTITTFVDVRKEHKKCNSKYRKIQEQIQIIEESLERAKLKLTLKSGDVWMKINEDKDKSITYYHIRSVFSERIHYDTLESKDNKKVITYWAHVDPKEFKKLIKDCSLVLETKLLNNLRDLFINSEVKNK